MKKLEIGNFHVKDIQFAEKTSFSDGILYVNKEEAMSVIDPQGKLKNVELHIVHPGDSVRIVPAKAAVEPRFRPDGRCIFPGYTGDIVPCGDGTIYAMKDVSVIVCGKYGNMCDGMIDMSGPGAEHTPFSQKVNLVIYAERVNEKDLDVTLREEGELRIAPHLLAEYLGKTLEGLEPEEWETYQLEEGRKEAREKHLPRVAFYMLTCSQLDEGVNDIFGGRDCHRLYPVLVHPNELLDGYLVGGLGLMGQGLCTYDMQNLPTLKRLYEEHGKTIEFVGVILVPGDVSDEIKLGNRVRSGEMADLLELDAAIVAEWAGGSNIDVDFFYNLAELSDRGLKVVGMTSEHGGKMMVDPKGDAIVSCADTASIIELPAMDKVIGDDESLIRDYFYGSWPRHEVYGPSLRPDGSVIVNEYMLAGAGNISGWLNKTTKDF